MWIFIALISPLSHGVANIFDNYLSNKVFSNVWVLIFFTSCFNILFIPLIFLFGKPSLPTFTSIPFLFGIAAIEVFYLYPYYKALQHDDTSVVVSLFSLGKVFIPILAYFILGEKLLLSQYIGFLIIIICGGLLTFKQEEQIRFNRSFLYMFLCTLLLAIEAILYKLAFEQISWVSSFTFQAIFSIPLVLSGLLFPKIRQGVKNGLQTFRRTTPVFLVEEFMTFIGLAASSYTISIVPVTYEKSIDSFQPFFAIFFAILFQKFFPRFFKEKIDKRSMLKKFLLFLLMIVGTVMVVVKD